ncbi:LPS-assembly protein LptD [Paracoccus spongiarum]|uniref:LPS-assembly protein LptD n=1 Tax=Paracoccus spongiarum TaxID=3064387 RepID=A0ABT9JAM5_9RHOB|nr:LPS assembly protein LptD [Paracoccus sp. 2205BS29-5]MDP5306876.1 LPS assembly protein LptD [Paracoccus sp. 2205BS29-5]
MSGQDRQTITGRGQAGLLAGLACWAVLAQPLAGQQLFDQTGRPTSSAMTGAPLATSSGEAALAPAAPALQDTILGDRTPGSAPLETVAPDADITLPARPAEGAAEDAATVLADSMELQGDRTLIAAGGVVVWYQGARLVASRLVVDGESGALTIEGPVHLSRPGAADPEAEAVLIADSAQLDRQLQDGIIRGARLVIARELQLAAEELTRSGEGRFTRLTRVVASSCQVCASDPTPLWEIRARSITHDAETRLLTLERPQLRAFGLPIASAPFTITAPDPTVERRTGFLRPEIRTTSGLGFGIKAPYFVTLGDQADLTLTPYLSASRTSTLELRYRRAWRSGVTEWNGAVSRDDIRPGETRGYLFGNALVDLPRDYRLGVQLQLASDRGYLLDYDITEADRLWSGLTLERITRDRLVFGRVGNYHSLRDDEDNATSPAQVADVLWQRRFSPRLIGGEGVMEWSVHAHRRPSDEDEVGRDVARGSVGLDWRRSEILPGGLVGAAIAGLDADLYRIAQDDRYDDVVSRVDPLVGVELRWPLAGSAGGATHLVEPVAQLLWSPRGEDDDIPNEDGRLIEFDEGNLFSDNRFPGWDARETGLRANVGVSWTRIDPAGWSLGLTGGRVLRAREDRVFAAGSPLAGRRSDWLLAAHYDSGTGLAVANRALFDDSFRVSRNELRLGWLRPDLQLSAGHLWIDSDADEGRPQDTSELTATLGWQIAEGWWGNAETRYDFAADRAQRASLDVTYRNECVTVEMGVSRRFTRADEVRPETSLDLSVRLGGFGSQKDGPGTVARRSCLR